MHLELHPRLIPISELLEHVPTLWGRTVTEQATITVDVRDLRGDPEVGVLVVALTAWYLGGRLGQRPREARRDWAAPLVRGQVTSAGQPVDGDSTQALLVSTGATVTGLVVDDTDLPLRDGYRVLPLERAPLHRSPPCAQRVASSVRRRWALGHTGSLSYRWGVVTSPEILRMSSLSGCAPGKPRRSSCALGSRTRFILSLGSLSCSQGGAPTENRRR
ncbi:MAG: hypothetical protein ACI9EF_003340 [Pseudohongiellaceae bacterium]|jgi:hypothetical protein